MRNSNVLRVASAAVLAAAIADGCSSGGDGADASLDAPIGDAATDTTPTDAPMNDASTDGGASSLHVMAFFGKSPGPPDNAYAQVSASGVLTGPVFVVPWSSVDHDGGALDWSSVDGPSSVLASYVAKYPTQKISVLFEPASDVNTNTATPADVLQSPGQQICFCSTYAGDYPDSSPPTCVPNGKWNGVPDYTGLPVPYTGTFAARWQGFIAQAITHLNASAYRSSILYVTFGVSNGGEDIPRCGTSQVALVDGGLAGLASVWVANVNAQDTAIQNAKPAFPVVGGTSCYGTFAPPDGSTNADNCTIFSEAEAQAHHAHGIGLRITTLQSADLLAYDAGEPTISDWVANNAKYADVPIVFQTAFESAPAPVTSGDATQVAQCNKTGSLARLVPFVMSHTSATTPLRVFEAYWADLEGTYVSGYVDTCWPNGTVTTDPYAPYDTVLKAATQ